MKEAIAIYWLAFKCWLFDRANWEDAMYYANQIIKGWVK